MGLPAAIAGGPFFNEYDQWLAGRTGADIGFHFSGDVLFTCYTLVIPKQMDAFCFIAYTDL